MIMRIQKMKFPKYLLLTAGSLVLCVFIAVSTCSGLNQKNIFLITYGADSLSIEGDNDHRQEVIIRVPETLEDKLYLRIFDMDTGGKWDAEFGFGKGWDSLTRFEFYGAELIRRETLGTDEARDDRWQTFASFLPRDGEKNAEKRVFRLWINGLSGDDGNVFDVTVSRFPDKNRKPDGAEIVSYEPTIRLPQKNTVAEMRFFVPIPSASSETSSASSGTSLENELTLHGFDLTWAKFGLTTAFRSDIRANPSGQNKWGKMLVRLRPYETGHRAALTFTRGEEEPNDATFGVSNNKGQRLPIQLPIIIAGKKNHHPVPRIRMKYLSDCHSVLFDASDSSDRDGDKMSYLWRFGDGKTGEGLKVTHRYEKQAYFEATLIVRDDSGEVGNSALMTERVHINQPPVSVVRCQLSPETDHQPSGIKQQTANEQKSLIAVPGQEIIFDGSDSYDSDGEIRRYSWDFDDGKKGSQEKMTHVFEKPGHYHVSLLIVDDSDGPCSNEDTDTWEIIVNAAPILELGKDRRDVADELIVFAPSEARDRDGKIISYLWDMGDGTQKSGEKISHGFHKPGKYTVTLTVSDDSGAANNTVSDRILININDPPVAVAGEDRRIAAEKKLRFDGSESYDPDGKLIALLWDFGDGAAAKGKKVSHSYEKPGTYEVRLTVEDNSGTLSSENSDTLTVIVNDPPLALPGKDRRIAPEQIIQFDGSRSSDSDGEIIAWLWDFGDETKADGMKVTHAYAVPGTYEVRLTVEDDSGTSSARRSGTLKIIVNHRPDADAGQNQILTASAVRFDGRGSGDPDGKIEHYQWDFGDGDTGTGVTPLHVYGNPGTYLVRLAVTDDSGTLNNRAEDEITVIINHNPLADAGPDQTGAPDQTLFFDGSRSFDPDGHITEYHWRFGDGHTASGAGDAFAKTSHVYKSPGTYAVQLTVRDDTGHKQAIDKDEAKVMINAAPVAMVAEKREGRLRNRRQIITAPARIVTFDGSGSYDPDGKIMAYLWDFRSSEESAGAETETETVTGMKISKLFSAPGIYSLLLTVRDDSGALNARSQDSVLIRVNHSPEARPGKNIFTCDKTVQFDGSASADADGDPISYLWDFGDGSPEKSGIRVIHTYAESGTYPVILSVDDGRGLENSGHTAALTVSINKAPVADAGEDQTSCAGDVVVLSGGRSFDPEAGLLKYHWDFGDNTSQEGLQNPIKIYKRGGTYQVRLTVEDDSGLECNTALDQMLVRVNQSPVADAGNDLSVCANTQVHFDGSKSWDVDGLVNTFFWDFGDGTTGGGPRPGHIFGEPGIYPVKLTITGDPVEGCDNINTTEITVRVQESPHAKIRGPLVAPVNSTVTFDGSDSKGDSGKIVSWAWDFGDGHSATGRETNHVYRKPGAYTITLRVASDAEITCNAVTTLHSLFINESPGARAGQDRFAGTEEIIVFDGSESYDSDGSVVRYEWDFGDGETGEGMEVLHSYQRGGQYQVTLRVTDDTTAENNDSMDNLLVTVNHPPRAVMGIMDSESGIRDSDFTVCAEEQVEFTAEKSDDPDGELLEKGKNNFRYYWNFGDGQKAEGLRVSHVYAASGVYQVSLIFDDGTGVSNSRSETNQEIVVRQPPVADPGPDRVVCPGEAVMFAGDQSFGKLRNPLNPLGKFRVLSYHWDFGDGKTAEGEEVSHVFEKSGVYKVRLFVSDNSETACANSENMIGVRVNSAPVAVAGGDREGFAGGAHDAVLFDGSRSHDPDGDPLTYSWDFGDGTHDFGAQVFHTYMKAGVYKVRLRVRDSVGREICSEGQDELNVTVRER